MAANTVGGVHMENKSLTESLEKKISQQKFESDVDKLKINSLNSSLNSQHKLTEEVKKTNGDLLLKIDEKNRTIKIQQYLLYAVGTIAVVEFFIIAIQ